jgi:four helix bundle protein
MNKLKGHRDLIVYQKAFALAMEIFHITKKFPKEETYSLVDQVRRSSRSVCSCLAEAYRKRHYPAYFANKCADADGENSETIVWLEFALASSYIEHEEFATLEEKAEEVGRILSTMIENPEKFQPKNNK